MVWFSRLDLVGGVVLFASLVVVVVLV